MTRDWPALHDYISLGPVEEIPKRGHGGGLTLSPAAQRIIAELERLEPGKSLHLVADGKRITSSVFEGIKRHGYVVTERRENGRCHVYLTPCTHHWILPAAGSGSTTKRCQRCHMKQEHKE